jgi:hypothetical protein
MMDTINCTAENDEDGDDEEIGNEERGNEEMGDESGNVGVETTDGGKRTYGSQVVRARKVRSRNTIGTEREKITEVSASGKPIVPIKLGQGTATKWDAFFEKSSQSTRST